MRGENHRQRTDDNIPDMTKTGNMKKGQRTVGKGQADVRVFLIWSLVKKQHRKIFMD